MIMIYLKVWNNCDISKVFNLIFTVIKLIVKYKFEISPKQIQFAS